MAGEISKLTGLVKIIIGAASGDSNTLADGVEHLAKGVITGVVVDKVRDKISSDGNGVDISDSDDVSSAFDVSDMIG